jgi:glycosyltransferase involved in cell wall biosynthesis
LQLLALAAGLRERGWDPVVVLPETGPLAARLGAAEVEVRIQSLAVLRRRLISPGGVAGIALAASRERKALAGLARDSAVVHSNSSVIVGGSAAARAAGVPHVVHVREIYAGAAGGLAARAWPLWRARLMRTDARVCVSGAVAAQFANDGDQGWGAGTHVVFDGLTRDFSPPSELTHHMGGSGPTARPFSVAVLGRIADWKGQDVLVRALAEPALAEIGAVAVIAGDAYPGEQAPDIEGLARSLGVHDRVRMLGFREDPAEVLASVDAVAVPSTRPDPLPNSAIEALAAGLPVVAAAHGGLTEIVRDRSTGILVRPGDPKALAKALRELADDPDRRTRMGEAAAADARQRFGLERMLDEIEGVYATLGIRR